MTDDAATRAEHRLIEQKEIYRQILDAIADMILVKGAQSRILWANKAFCDYYGMSNAQLRDIIDAPFNEPDYTLQYIRDDSHVYATGRTLDIPEEPVTRHDGLEQIFHTVKSPLRDEQGRVRMTVGVSRNITEQKRIKEELARYRHRLEDLVEARTAELADLSDRRGDVQLMNAAAENLTGWPEHEARGRPCSELVIFEADARGGRGRHPSGSSSIWETAQRLTGALRSRDGPDTSFRSPRRDSRQAPAEDLRPLLHDQGGGKRPGPRLGALDRAAPRRAHHGRLDRG